MATLVSSTLVGVKENVADDISMISSQQRPFTKMIDTEKTKTIRVDWQEDELAAVNLANRRVEGADPVEDNGAETDMRTTYVQHLDSAIKISDIADTISKYGRKSEIDRRSLKRGAELARDLEGIMLNSQVTSNTGNAPALGSYQSQIDPSLRFATGDALTAPTEKNLLDALQALYVEGADPSVIMVSPDYSVTLTEFSKAAGRYREIPNVGTGSKAIVNAVELFVSPFGQQKVVINRFSQGTDTFLFDPSMWHQLVYTPWTKEELQRTGRATKVQIFGTYGLRHENQKASAVIRKVTGTNGKF